MASFDVTSCSSAIHNHTSDAAMQIPPYAAYAMRLRLNFGEAQTRTRPSPAGLQLEPDGATVRFHGDVEPKEAAAVTFCLHGASYRGQRVLRRGEAQSMTCGQILALISTSEQI